MKNIKLIWLISLLFLVISICGATSQTNQWLLKSFDTTMLHQDEFNVNRYFVATDSAIIEGAGGRYVYPQTDGSIPHFTDYFWNVYCSYPAVTDGTVIYGSGGRSIYYTYNDVYYGLLNSDGTPDKSSYTTNPFRLNTARDCHASAIYNGRYYVAGGNYIVNRDGLTTPTNTVEYAVMQPNHSLGPFQYLTPLNRSPQKVYLSWVNGNRWYVMGSDSWSDGASYILRNTFKADGTLGDWTTLLTLPTCGPAAINNQNIIVMVERWVDSTGYNKTYLIQYDPIKESFTVINGHYTVVGRGEPAVTSWKQYVYVLGGQVPGGFSFFKSYEMMVPSVTPTKKVNKLSAIPSYGGVQLSWENPNLMDYAGTLIVSRTDRYPMSPTDGNMVYWYNGDYCNVAVPNGQKAYFGVFSHDTSYSFSSGAFVSAIPNSYQNISKTSLSEPWVGAEVLSWANPTVTNQYDATIVLRRTDRYPTDPADGYNATDGSWFRYWYNGTGMGELGLTDTSYFYLLYANDTFMNFSNGVGGRYIPGWTGIPNVSQVASYPGYGSISISWVNPTTGNYNNTLIVRNSSHYPT